MLADLDSFCQSPLTGQLIILINGWLKLHFGTTSGSLKQIPPVACMELVAAEISMAGEDVRGYN